MKLTKKVLQCRVTEYSVTVVLEEAQEVIDYPIEIQPKVKPLELKPKVKPWRGPKDVYNIR